MNVPDKMSDVCRINFGSEHLIYVSLKSTQYTVIKFKTLIQIFPDNVYIYKSLLVNRFLLRTFTIHMTSAHASRLLCPYAFFTPK
jgi:hypothetical protein